MHQMVCLNICWIASKWNPVNQFIVEFSTVMAADFRASKYGERKEDLVLF